jgi:GNAT superfamily N-acetyltransferase
LAYEASWVVRAKVRNKTVGFAWVVAGVPEASVYIEETAVVADMQRRGVGSRLVVEAVRWMAELGYETVTITPISGTAWVERLGFRLAGHGLYEASTAGFG